jgi:phosphoserine phosphatase
MNREASANKVIAIFDFDKTLVKIDSFRLFARIIADSLGSRLWTYWQAVLCKLGMLTNTRYKEKILEALWFPKTLEIQARLLEVLLEHLRKQQHPVIVRRMLEHAREGDVVVVMSASPEFYLRPFLHSLCPQARIVGSRVTLHGSTVKMQNLQGEQKAERAQALIEGERPARICVYTDHIVDLPLVWLADRAVLVRPSRRLVRGVRHLGIEHEVIA